MASRGGARLAARSLILSLQSQPAAALQRCLAGEGSRPPYLHCTRESKNRAHDRVQSDTTRQRGTARTTIGSVGAPSARPATVATHAPPHQNATTQTKTTTAPSTRAAPLATTLPHPTSTPASMRAATASGSEGKQGPAAHAAGTGSAAAGTRLVVADTALTVAMIFGTTNMSGAVGTGMATAGATTGHGIAIAAYGAT